MWKKAVRIWVDWDLDDENEPGDGPPAFVDVPEDVWYDAVDNAIDLTDWLTNTYGWLVNNWETRTGYGEGESEPSPKERVKEKVFDPDLIKSIDEVKPDSLIEIFLDDGAWSGPINVTAVDNYYVHTITPGGYKGGIDKGKIQNWINAGRLRLVQKAPDLHHVDEFAQSWPDTLPWGEQEQNYYRNSSTDFQTYRPGDKVRNIWTGEIGIVDGEDERGIYVDWYESEDYSLVEPHDIEPLDPREQQNIVPDTLPEGWGKVASGIPANYSEDDPLDMETAKQLVDDLDSQWWTEPPDVQRQAIANAFRAALTSPRQNLKWNSIVYQDMQHLGAEVADPDVFENTIRQRKTEWDRFGQQTIDTLHQHATDPKLIDYGKNAIEKYMPGIWGNIRNAGVVGPYVEVMRNAAMEDVAQGGTGQYFRQVLLDLNIPGIGPKIAAFVWLLLCPKTSKLATVDIHMMRALGQEAESPKDYTEYLKFENQLDEQRKAMGYDDVPLGAYQWALWDWQRTPGYHQDHTPLRPLNPVDWRNVDWAPQLRTRKKTPEPMPEGQQSLLDTPASPAQNVNGETNDQGNQPVVPFVQSWRIAQ